MQKKTGQKRKDIYEQAGVEEYWIVSPQGSVEIYYLQDGKYVLEQNYLLQVGKEDEEYNAELEICLKAFPILKCHWGKFLKGCINLAAAARGRYPAALLRCKFDVLPACCGVFNFLYNAM